MKKIVVGFFLLCLIAGIVSAFAGPPPEPELLIDLPKDKDQPVKLAIREIRNLDSLEGQIVIINGIFRGWDDIKEPPPFSRLDWVIEDETGAIHVHGPYPEGCDPMVPETYGRPIEVAGKVKAKMVSHFGLVRRIFYIKLLPN